MPLFPAFAKTYTNVRDYGAVGDGINDDTANIQNVFNSATPGSIIYFPPGVYLISASLQFPGNIKILGSGASDSGSIIRVKTGTALATPILASKDWYANAIHSGNPVEICDLMIDANSATTGSNAHGLVLMNYWSIVENVSISGPAGDGLLLSAQTRNGTHILNTCVETKLIRIQARNCGNSGIHVQDNGTGLNSCTDGFIEDCIIQGAGYRGIDVEMGPGWKLNGNHIYGTVSDAINVSKCYATRVDENYVDGYGSGSSTYIAGIGMTMIDGRGSSCIGNHIDFSAGTASGVYQGLVMTGAGSGITKVTVLGNTIVGGSQSGSLGMVFQTQNSQHSYPFFIYSCFNDVQAVSTTLYEDSYVSQSDNLVIGHLGSNSQNAPTAAPGAQAGAGAPTPILANCSDLSGQITFGTGTGAAAGAQVVVTFNGAYGVAPKVILTPINSASSLLYPYVSSTQTNFTVSCALPSSSQPNTTYGFNYIVMI